MNKEFDDKIKNALRPSLEADFWLNQKIISKSLEVRKMKKNKFKGAAAAAIALCLVLAGSAGVMAAVRFFTPSEIADEVHDEGLSEAFKSDMALQLSETQSMGGYDFNLIGMVSGEELSDYESMSDGKVLSDRTYAVAAITNSDGTPMQEKDEEGYQVAYEFYVSPLVKGYAPWQLNVNWLNGGCTYFVREGVLYWLVECDNVEIFADNTIYLSITEGNTPGSLSEAYNYNQDTGEITRNESFEGVNALFTLPIDKSKADKEAVEKYLEEIGYEK